MLNATTRLPNLFFDAFVTPTYEILTALSTSVSYYGNHNRPNSSSEIVNVEMTAGEMQMYMTIKSFWASSTTLVLAVIFGMVLYTCYIFFFVPYNRVKRLGTIGYLKHEEGSMSKKDVANIIRQRRKYGENMPPVFPNGWFRLLDSWQLPSGEVKEVTALGEHFAVFRSQAGDVSVLDAYCPHMGGNLAVGGIVKGDCLECPFHGWKFDGDGLCVSIPYTEKVPSFAKTKSWPCREVNQAIYVWYHCDGVGPEWEIPVIEEIKKGDFHYRGRVEHHVNTHIQDLPENGSDQAHLSHLHVPFVSAGNNLSTQFSSWLNICDHVFKIGPGIVHLHFTSWLWKGIFVQSLTPHEPLHQVLTHNLYSNWSVPTWLGRIFLYMEAIQVDRDVMIWNNKTFRATPKLLKEDKLISQYRRWFSQFYTKNSPRLQMKSKDGLEW